jgi:hypothetical protein
LFRVFGLSKLMISVVAKKLGHPATDGTDSRICGDFKQRAIITGTDVSVQQFVPRSGHPDTDFPWSGESDPQKGIFDGAETHSRACR